MVTRYFLGIREKWKELEMRKKWWMFGRIGNHGSWAGRLVEFVDSRNSLRAQRLTMTSPNDPQSNAIGRDNPCRCTRAYLPIVTFTLRRDTNTGLRALIATPWPIRVTSNPNPTVLPHTTLHIPKLLLQFHFTRFAKSTFCNKIVIFNYIFFTSKYDLSLLVININFHFHFYSSQKVNLDWTNIDLQIWVRACVYFVLVYYLFAAKFQIFFYYIHLKIITKMASPGSL